MSQTIIPTWFISDYMPQASTGALKVYLYLLMLHTQEQHIFLADDVTQPLNMLYSELIESLNYWEKLKLLSFTSQTTNNMITFALHLTQKQSTPTEPMDLFDALDAYFFERPRHTQEEIASYKEQDTSLDMFFNVCENLLGHPLILAEQSILLTLREVLCMSLELIVYLVEYCVSNQHTYMPYIEKVALSWHEKGIHTIEDAKVHTVIAIKYRKILKALGLKSDMITPFQMKLFDKWLDAYDFSLELILEGCRRTVLSASKPSLGYLETILERWHQHNVKTLEDITALDNSYYKSLTTQEAPEQELVSKSPYFTAIHKHNFDIEEIERIERERMLQNILELE